jgi:hypothetical protein
MQEIREGLAANLSTIPDLVESAYVFSNPMPPCAEVLPTSISYDQAHQRGLDYLFFTVRVYVANTLNEAAQKKLDLMLAATGEYSVKTALESDGTLGGAADDLQVTECTGYRIYPRDGGASLLGAEWTVRVLASS